MNFPSYPAVASTNEFAETWSRYVWESSWQSAIVAIFVLGIVLSCRRLPAKIKYAILIVALIKFAVPPFFSTPTGLFSALPERPISGELMLDNAAGVGAKFGSESTWRPEEQENHRSLFVDSRSDKNRLEPNEEVFAANPDVAGPALPSLSNRNLSESDSRLPATPESRFGQSGFIAASSTESTTTLIEPLAVTGRVWLLLCYAVGFVAWSAFLAVSCFRVSTLRRRSQTVTSPEILAIYQKTAQRLRMKSIPRLATSTELTTPIAFGCLRPIVLLPTSILQDPRATEIAIAHELAHHRRRDPWVNSFQNILLIVWWFNPLLWILNKEVRRVREDCCDDIVLEHGIADRVHYSDSLLAIARLTQTKKSPPITVALGMLDVHPLAKRLRRIMDPSIVRTVNISWRTISLLVAIAMVALPGLRASNELANPAVPLESIEKNQEETIEANQDITESAKPPRELGTDELKTITGVVQRNGEPAAGIEVRLYPYVYDADGAMTAKRLGETKSRSDGTFEMKVESGKLLEGRKTIVCCDENGQAIGGQYILRMIDSLNEPFQLRSPISLIDPVSQTIELVDQNDKPISGVRIETTRFEEISFRRFKKQRFRPSATQGYLIPEEVSNSIQSNSDGKFTNPVVPKYGVSTLAIELPDGFKASVAVSTDTKRIRLDTSASAKGTLRCDQPGFDWSGVWVQATYSDNPLESEDFHVRTSPRASVNSNGMFEF